ATGKGIARADGVGYVVAELRSGRESFKPDASYYDRLRDTNRLRFIPGPPTLAVEVRSEDDYGSTPERERADHRADAFEAATKVGWNVDPVAETVAISLAAAPTTPMNFRRGEVADVEPAVPGWRMAVDDMFPDLAGPHR